MSTKYVSGRVRELKVGITSYSEDKTSLNVVGNANIGTGVTVYGDAGIVSATKFYGDGSTLSGVSADASSLKFGGVTKAQAISAGVVITGNAGIGSLSVTGVSTLGVSTFTGAVSFGSSALFGDNDKILLGNGGTEFQVYHDGSTSVIKSGEGNLNLQTASGEVILGNSAGEVGVSYKHNDRVEIRHDNTTRFQTSGVGVTVYNQLDTTNVSASSSVTATNFYGSGANLTGISADTLGDLSNLVVTGISSVGSAITMYGTTGIISATSLNITSNITAPNFKTVGTGVSIANAGLNTATIFGPQEIVIDPSPVGVATTSGIVRIKGDLYVDGKEFIVNSETITLGDFVVGIATTVTSDTLTDGAGIGIGSIGHEKTFKYEYNSGTNPSLKSSENLNVATSKGYQIAETEVLNATTLGTSVVNSSLTSVGTLGSLKVTGITSASAFADFDYLQAPYGSTTTFTVTVATKDSTHRYNGTGSGNGYLINGVQAPVLTLTPGRTYRFTNDNTGSHPLKFYYEADKTTLYTTGVNFQNAYTEITVSDTTPNVLHYQCTAHVKMGNAVITNSNVVDTPYTLNVGTAITAYSSTGIVSATSFYGDGSNLTGIAGNIENSVFENITASGYVSIADTITHTGDTNTKIRFPSADNISMETAGTERFRIDPTGILKLYGDNGNNSVIYGHRAGNLSYILGNQSGTNDFNIKTWQSSSDIIFSLSGNNEKVRITSGGDVGIGTTIPTGVNAVSGNNATLAVGILTANTLYGDGSNLSNVLTTTGDGASISNGIIVGLGLSISGIATVTDTLKVGTGITANAGVITATSFYGTLQTGNQPQITTVGTLGSLTVTNNITANGNIVGDTATNISGINSVTATKFFGDGSGLLGTGGETLISGITVKEEGTNVGTGGSIKTINFIGGSVTAAISGSDTANVTIDSGVPSDVGFWRKTNAGIHTLTNVGVGTTNPDHTLTVDAGISSDAFVVKGSTGTLLSIANDATADLFSVNDVSGINVFKIDSNRTISMANVGAGDSVGIGTTVPRSGSKLDVEGIVKATTFSGSGADLTSIPNTALNTITTANKVGLAALDIDGGTDIGADLVDADLFIVDDAAGGTNRKTAASRIKTYVADVTLTNGTQTAITSVGNLNGLSCSSTANFNSTVNLNSNVNVTTDLMTITDKIVHSGDANTAIRFPANDTFSVETAGSERLRILSGGQVAIGTATEGNADADELTINNSSDHGGITIRTPNNKFGNIYFSDATTGVGETVGKLSYDHSTDAMIMYVGGAERLRIASNGALAIEGATNYGTSTQVLTSNGNDAPTWQAIPAQSGGSGDFNTGITSSLVANPTGVGVTVLTLPATAGKTYTIESIHVANVASGNTETNIVAAFEMNGGDTSYFAYNVPVPTGTGIELLKQPMVLNPSDKIVLRSTDYDRNGADSIQEGFITFTTNDDTDHQGIAVGSATLSGTSAVGIYTSSSHPSVIQSIRVVNRTDSGAYPISISIVDASAGGTIRLVDNLIVPKYGTVELLDTVKRINTGAIIKATLDQGGTIDVQISAKKIT